MKRKIEIEKIVDNLKKAKQPQSDFVKLMENFNDPFLVLISCILSLRTNDKTTYPATLRMLKLGKTPEDFTKVKIEELEKAIYPVGFYTNKAKQIIEQERVFINGQNETKLSKQIKLSDVITIRGEGRFVIKEFEGTKRTCKQV